MHNNYKKPKQIEKKTLFAQQQRRFAYTKQLLTKRKAMTIFVFKIPSSQVEP